jgi:hypothetical protein
MDKAQEPAPDRPESPLFEPERSPPPPYLQQSVPEAVMVNPDAPEAVPVEEPTKEPTGRFIIQLKKLEAIAIAEMSSWSPAHLGQASETPAAASTNALKRKGELATPYYKHD